MLFDGTSQVIYYPNGGVGFPSVYIEKPTHLVVGRQIQFSPWFLTFRPLDREIGQFDRAKIRAESSQVSFDGVTCVVITQPPPAAGGPVRTVYADPSRGYLPIHYLVSTKGIITEQASIRYRQDKNDSWVPSGWDISILDASGQPSYSWSGNVVEYRLNPEMADSTFHFVVPGGTWVSDGIAKQIYILRPDGTRRPVTKGEYNGKNFTQLMNSEPPEQFGWARIIGIGAAAVVLGAALIPLLCAPGYRKSVSSSNQFSLRKRRQ